MNVPQMLRTALDKLQTQRSHLDRQIASLQLALRGGGAKPSSGARAKTRKRRGMSQAARKAASLRMKAYWAKRRKAKNASR